MDETQLTKVVDRDPKTVLSCPKNEVVIDLGRETEISTLMYLPDQSEGRRGLIHLYTVAACNADGSGEKTLKEGEFSNIQNNPVLQTVTFPTVKTRYLKLKANRMVTEGEQMSIAELGVK